MSPRKKMTSKAPATEAFGSGQQIEDEPDTPGAMYDDDTTGLLEKEGDALRWGDVYQMFKKQNLSIDVEDQDELRIFKNIRRSGIFRVAARVVVFPCVDAITWILKNIDLRNIYVCNSRKEPIALFRLEYLAKCYHLEKGIKKLDSKLLDEFEYTAKELFPKWYKADKQSKHRPKGGYPTTALRRPYQYMVAMLCKIYGEPDASQFSLSYMPLIYYCADEGFSFNWDDILSAKLKNAITTVAESH
jgi:hypothetical protein